MGRANQRVGKGIGIRVLAGGRVVGRYCMETSGRMEEEEIEILQAQAKESHYYTRIGVLSAHNGLRRGKVHTFLGATHSGKSTLVRTIVADLLTNNNCTIALWLSEETREDFLLELSLCRIPKKKLEGLHIFSEVRIEKGRASIDDFKRHCASADIVVFDNLTTSEFYMDTDLAHQSRVSKFLKRFAQTLHIPMVLIAHTRTGIGENYTHIINAEDIRGCRTIVNLTEFFYVMQNLYVENEIYPFIRIAKHRGQEVGNKLFQLEYDKGQRIFTGGRPRNFAEFKELFKMRNRL